MTSGVYKRTIRHRLNIGKAMSGKEFTDGHKENISKSIQEQWKIKTKEEKQIIIKVLDSHRKNFKGEQHGMYGKHHTIKAKKAMSETVTGKKHSNNSRKKMRKSAIGRIEKSKLNGLPLTPCIGTYETVILDNLEKSLTFEILRQYRVNGFFLDGYIPDLNLAIEIDENHHFNEDGELCQSDLKRQMEIEKELNCQFLRINTMEVSKNGKSV